MVLFSEDHIQETYRRVELKLYAALCSPAKPKN